MKKRLRFYGALFLIPIIALLVVSFGNKGNSNDDVTDSLLDNQLAPQSYLTCHNNNGNFNTAVSITSDILSGGYALGQTYNMTVTQAANGVSKHGFQIIAENNAPNKIGGFGITDATNTHLQAGNNLITHTLSGTDQSFWNFISTDATTDVGSITFYVTSIPGNLNNTGGATTANNQMAQNTWAIGSVLAVSDKHLLKYRMSPNPSDGIVSFLLSSNINQGHISVFDYSGKLMIQKNINTPKRPIDISYSTAGIYVVKI